MANKKVKGVVVELHDLNRGEAYLLFHTKFDVWTPVTGKVDEGETYVEAAIRELGEEIGVFVSEDDMRYVCDLADDTQDLQLFRVFKTDSMFPENMEPSKHRELKVFDMKKVVELPLFDVYKKHLEED